jgi:orotidine-5'-phosphate decarboxylase
MRPFKPECSVPRLDKLRKLSSSPQAHRKPSMNFFTQLQNAQQQNNSLLCVGLDPEPAKFPAHMAGKRECIFDFCAQIVDATHDLVIAFKPQIAYFAAHRAEAQLEALIQYMHQVAPNVPVILDAKRGDIGSTAQQYAVEAFERYRADAVTVSPFMGFDSIEPYLHYPGKGVIVLCRTSNPGGNDWQFQRLANVPGQPLLFEHLAHLAQTEWNHTQQIGLVVGATYPQEIAKVRELAPHLPLLIPGIGAQGGDPIATVQAGWRPNGPIAVNSSRAVLYASNQANFAQAARQVAMDTRETLNSGRSLLHLG